METSQGKAGTIQTKAEAVKIAERSKDASNPKETRKIVSQIWTN
jgi:hypothetical protein